MAEIIEQCGGLTFLDKLQLHPNSQVYTKTVKIIEDFFGAEDEDITTDNTESISIFNF